MNLLEVAPDQTNVTIKLKSTNRNYVELVYVRRTYRFAIFRANNWRNFWNLWNGNKLSLKKNRLELDKNNNGKWEIYLPIWWYHENLTEKALKQLKQKRYKENNFGY